MYPRKYKTSPSRKQTASLFAKALLSHHQAMATTTTTSISAPPPPITNTQDLALASSSSSPPPPAETTTTNTNIIQQEEEEEEGQYNDLEPAPREVTRQGLTLRQLYQLKRDADAWNLVEKKQCQDQALRDQALRLKQQADKRALSQCYDRQVQEKQHEHTKTQKEMRDWAHRLQVTIDQATTAEAQARRDKITHNALYRAEFCQDIARLQQVQHQAHQKRLALEQAEVGRAQQLALEEAREMQRKKQANFERMKKIQLEVKQQMVDRATRKEEEAAEILKLEKEWVAAMDKKDRDRHAAFQKIVARQEAKAACFTSTTQEIIKKQLEEDEKRALKYQAALKQAQEEDDLKRKAKKQAATRAQVEALELEIRLGKERKERLRVEEQVIAQEMLARDKAAYQDDMRKKREARGKLREHTQLLAKQIEEQQQQNQRVVIGFVQPSEMALNKTLFESIGYVSPDPKAPPVQYLQAYKH